MGKNRKDRKKEYGKLKTYLFGLHILLPSLLISILLILLLIVIADYCTYCYRLQKLMKFVNKVTK